jgi:hypothetical protein
MKDKKFKPLVSGKSYNFDLNNSTKKSFVKDSSPLRVKIEKNQFMASNDFESERSIYLLTRKSNEQSLDNK